MGQTRNVVFIGEIGSGKSSVINLIADRPCAGVSPDATPCTDRFTPYDVSIWEKTYRLWDTPGLNKPTGLARLFRRTTTTASSLKRFLQERHRRRELDLLVFCIRGRRVNQSMLSACKIFCRATAQIGIPVAIAITHLERQQPTMDVWWQDNERELRSLGLMFDDYACLTCLSRHHRRWHSREAMCALISKVHLNPPPSMSTPLGEYLAEDSNTSCVVC